MITDIFNREFGTNYNLKYESKTKSYRFLFLRCGPIQNLVKLGIHHNKTYENDDSIFISIPDELKRHFIRGFFDGDGSVRMYKNKARVGFVSLNNKLLNSIMDYLHLNGFLGVIRIDKSYTRLIFNGNPSCKAFLDWMYRDCTICMKRKYDIYTQIPEPCFGVHKYIGVRKHRNKFSATIHYDKNRCYLGSFNSVSDALNAYNQKALSVGKPIQEYKGDEFYYE